MADDSIGGDHLALDQIQVLAPLVLASLLTLYCVMRLLDGDSGALTWERARCVVLGVACCSHLELLPLVLVYAASLLLLVAWPQALTCVTSRIKSL